tara:strand:- start:147 stop:758 length:612 start_codon:yes stop_codon:yes gene_type:complete
MALNIEPDFDIPLPGMDTGEVSKKHIQTRLNAAAMTASMLAQHGLKIEEPTREDRNTAAGIAAAYAHNPVHTSKNTSTTRMTPAALILTQQILDDYAHQIVTSSVQIRHLVTNKLLQETENPDPKIRLRALELLGKQADVGLFNDKQEITVTHQTTDDLKSKLREKLLRLRDVTPGEEEPENKPLTLSGEIVDLDEALGIEGE